jgi:hypothetical protein
MHMYTCTENERHTETGSTHTHKHCANMAKRASRANNACADTCMPRLHTPCVPYIAREDVTRTQTISGSPHAPSTRDSPPRTLQGALTEPSPLLSPVLSRRPSPEADPTDRHKRMSSFEEQDGGSAWDADVRPKLMSEYDVSGSESDAIRKPKIVSSLGTCYVCGFLNSYWNIIGLILSRSRLKDAELCRILCAWHMPVCVYVRCDERVCDPEHI